MIHPEALFCATGNGPDPDKKDVVLSFLDSALIFLTITEDGLRKNKWADMVALGKKAYREYAGEDWKPEGNGK